MRNRPLSHAWQRNDPDALAPTITTRCSVADGFTGRLLHWEADRCLTVMEVRRAQGYPDREVLIGTPANQWKVVGNGVARGVALALGLSLRSAWLGNLKKPRNVASAIATPSALGNGNLSTALNSFREPSQTNRDSPGLRTKSAKISLDQALEKLSSDIEEIVQIHEQLGNSPHASEDSRRLSFHSEEVRHNSEVRHEHKRQQVVHQTKTTIDLSSYRFNLTTLPRAVKLPERAPRVEQKLRTKPKPKPKLKPSQRPAKVKVVSGTRSSASTQRITR